MCFNRFKSVKHHLNKNPKINVNLKQTYDGYFIVSKTEEKKHLKRHQ